MRRDNEKFTADKVWLFSKLVLFLLIAGAMFVATIVVSLTFGFVVAGSLGASFVGRLLAVVSSVMMYVSCSSGRAWAMRIIGNFMFSDEDIKWMDDYT